MSEPYQLEAEYLTEYIETSLDPGVKKLFRAVLDRAIRDLQRCPDTGLIEWFNCLEPGNIFAFRSICELLHLDSVEFARSAMSRETKRKYLSHVVTA